MVQRYETLSRRTIRLSPNTYDTSIYMTFGCEMDDAIHLVVLYQFQHQVKITDITLYESIVRLILDVLEVSQITCVSQLVEVDDVILRIFVHEKSYYMWPMKPAPPVINILCILTNLFFRNPSTLRSHPAKTGETSDGPLTLERSGSEHAKSVRLHPRFLRKRGLGRKWSSLWKGRRRDLKKV